MGGVTSQVLLVDDIANILAGLLAVNQDDQSTEYRRGVAAGIRAVAAATGARLPPAVLVWDVATTPVLVEQLAVARE